MDRASCGGVGGVGWWVRGCRRPVQQAPAPRACVRVRVGACVSVRRMVQLGLQLARLGQRAAGYRKKAKDGTG